MTIQTSDSILYMGEVHPLYSHPMGRHLLQLGGGISSADMRGYVAHWKIDDNALILMRFEDTGAGLLVPLADLPIHATWFSGDLRVQDGAEVEKARDLEFGATYQREIVLKVEGGIVVGSEIVNFQWSEPIRVPGLD